jgi:hypothetical protein
MTTLDPATGRPLPDSAIQRVLFICPRVHVYQIPPLTSNKGFSAGSWTAPPRPTAQMIFTARLRIIETSLSNQIKTDIVLEDPKTGDLFAACPYTSPAVVEQASDSSRFFAVRVVGEGGMKATLGMGFEERPDAFDFSITLSEARKLLAMPQNGHAQSQQSNRKTDEEPKKDFSLKEGQSIHVEIGGRGRRQQQSAPASNDDGNALFSIRPPPPPASGDDFTLPSLAPPPSAAHAKTASKSPSPARQQPQYQAPRNQNQPSAQDLGFDDGEFGEFQ